MEIFVKKRLLLMLIMNFGFLFGMDKDDAASQGANTLECMRIASIVKNRVFELKAELNYTDTSGFLSLMHLSALDPSRNQTKQGIFLESIDGVPSAIHLPFGRWQFATLNTADEGHSKKLMNKIIQEFDLELHKIKLQNQRQVKSRTCIGNGPLILIYAIRRIGQNQLEKGVYKEETEYMNAMHAKTAWKALITE